MTAKILLTGTPGIGKTTVIKEVCRKLGQDVGGFYTEEVRVGGRRVGFDIVTLDGRRVALSRAGKKSGFRVGRYGVDVAAIDSVAVDSIEKAMNSRKAIIIDEIGKMELFSQRFRESVKKAFDSPNSAVAVIMLKTDPFADSVKQRPDVKTIEVTTENRDSLSSQILAELESHNTV